jgi:GT2 family glycosyltransferase
MCWRAKLLYRSLGLADAVGSKLRQRAGASRPPLRGYKPGITVIIPERENPEVLAECLENAVAACREVAEPSEIIVSASGSRPSAYRELMQRHPQVLWLFSERPLWYSGAVKAGLRAANFEWVYLLNSDMILDPMALNASLQWRSPEVFAIASQVFFRDATKRREETGWTLFRTEGGPIEIFDQAPDDDATIRGTFYAGGGASLFRRDLLRVLAPGSGAYEPFYWEDVEWGARAWRLGYSSIYCPASRAWHLHRMTNRLFFGEAEIDRILARNRVIYYLRNGPPLPPLDHFKAILAGLGVHSRNEALALGRMARIVWGRLQSARLPVGLSALENVWELRYGVAEPCVR